MRNEDNIPTQDREELQELHQRIAAQEAELTQCRQLLTKSEENSAQLKQIILNMPVLFDAFDDNGVALFWNKECERVTGYRADEIVGNPKAMELLVPDVAYRNCVLEQLHQLGHSYRDWELDIICKNGEKRTISWSNISCDYSIPGWWSWGVGVDVTGRKQAEETLKVYSEQLEKVVKDYTEKLQETQEQLMHREKLAVLGQMAGSVGHELRNPLSTISNAVYYLKMIIPETNDTLIEYIEIIARETQNAEGIISGLLDFARIKTMTKKDINVQAVVELVQERWKPSDAVQLILDIPDELPEFLADLRHIEQVLLNLVINACEAMPTGGTLTIKARTMNGHIALSVSDTGIGISDENMKKIFEPLFTTKTKGIGLGLAISKDLIEANGGNLLVESERGQGTTFTLIFPLKG